MTSMVIFKEKKSRQKNSRDLRVTIDATHKSKMKEFDKQIEMLPTYRLELTKLINKKNLCTNIETIQDLDDQISHTKKKISRIESNNDLNSYLLDTSITLFQYYDSNNISKGEENKSKTIVDFFSDTNKVIKKEPKKTFNKKYSRNEIINNYLNIVDKNYIPNVETESIYLCSECMSERSINLTEGIIYCTKCGTQDKILVDTDKPSYKEPPREISYFAYKRINHFNEWLAQFQAKESTDIPKDVYRTIRLELNKEYNIQFSNLKVAKIREILKKIGLNKYYEHVPHIINRLNGKPAPIINRKIEEKLRMMFKEIQTPWIKHCPNKRSNFLSYSYVLYKCLQLLEMDDLLCNFSLLKSREKLAEQDKLWRLICTELRWQFIQTI